MKKAIYKVVMEFLEDIIITRFGVLTKITIDNAKAFSSTNLSNFCFNYGIHYSTHLIITHKGMVWQSPTIKI